jgi:hypothetical protein
LLANDRAASASGAVERAERRVTSGVQGLSTRDGPGGTARRFFLRAERG